MSNKSILRRQRDRASRRIRSNLAPVCVVPGAIVPTTRAPLCSHREPMVFTACACHPREGGWQCGRLPLNGHMKRVR